MSRRRGEFEHRTSIFEGAYRAWSHLGGLELKDLETKPASELDPFVFPLVNDPRLTASSTSKDGVGASSKKNDDNAEGNIGAGEEGGEGGAQQRPGTADGGGSGGSARPSSSSPPQQAQREYPYEPLPRTGLAHPFVQAILSPWLGPDADQDAILLGLTSLRTWWQHRRKGESGSAIIALGTESMRGVVDGYTRHFFHLAHCLVVNDKEPPPRTLQTKMKDLDKSKVTKGKKRSREDGLKAADMAFQSGFGPNIPPQVPQQQQWEGMMPMGGDTTGNSLSTVEQLFALQRQQLDQSGGVNNFGGMGMIPAMSNNPADVTGYSSGSADLPILVQQVSNAATQLAHRGIQSSNYGMQRPSKLNDDLDPLKYGDPSIAPIVVVSPNATSGMNDIQLYMFIDGITCAHCIKIIETVLKGCPGSRSPIDGLLDAAADMELKAAIIKIDNIADSRRIAYEAAQNLSMVGYVAKARSFNLPNDISLQRFYAVTEGCTPSFAPMMSFQWNSECACPGNNVTRQDCPR
jgi:copper chaperone CopZ